MDPTDTEKPRTITVKWLRDLGACSDQVKLFAATFPDGAPITVEAALAAARTGLELSWFAERVLDDAALRAYHEAVAPARRAYDEALAPAQRAYREATATAQRAYHKAVAPAQRAYDEATAPALRAYHEALATERRAYREATAPALVAALLSMKETR